MAGRCSCRHRTHGGGGRESRSRVTVRATTDTRRSLCSARLPVARRPPARGQPCLPVSLAPNSAPTRAAAAAGRQLGAWHPALSCVLFIVRKHSDQPSQPCLCAGGMCRARDALDTAPAAPQRLL